MKAIALGLGAGIVFGSCSLQVAFAQSSPHLGFSATANSALQCSVSQMREASATMKQATKNAITQSMICTGSSKSGVSEKYEVGFLGVDFPNLGTYTDAGARITANIELACVNNKKIGIYFYAGYPVGFQTRTKGFTPYFSSQESGRCFLQGNSPLLQNVNAIINQSVMVVVPVEAQL